MGVTLVKGGQARPGYDIYLKTSKESSFLLCVLGESIVGHGKAQDWSWERFMCPGSFQEDSRLELQVKEERKGQGQRGWKNLAQMLGSHSQMEKPLES